MCLHITHWISRYNTRATNLAFTHFILIEISFSFLLIDLKSYLFLGGPTSTPISSMSSSHPHSVVPMLIRTKPCYVSPVSTNKTWASCLLRSLGLKPFRGGHWPWSWPRPQFWPIFTFERQIHDICVPGLFKLICLFTGIFQRLRYSFFQKQFQFLSTNKGDMISQNEIS